MKIVAADVIVSSPDRNFAALKITTDERITGRGDGTLNGRQLAVAAYLRDHVRAGCLPFNRLKDGTGHDW